MNETPIWLGLCLMCSISGLILGVGLSGVWHRAERDEIEQRKKLLDEQDQNLRFREEKVEREWESIFIANVERNLAERSKRRSAYERALEVWAT